MRRGYLSFSYLVPLCGLLLACGTSDTTAPAPPIVDPVDTQTPATSIDVSGTAEFNSTVKLTTSAGDVSTTADPYTARWFAKVDLSAGANQLRVTATDAAGNTSDPTLVDITQGPYGNVAPFTMALQLAQPSAYVGIPLGFKVIAVDAKGDPADPSTLAITTSDPSATISIPNHTITFGTRGTPAHTVSATLFGGTANEVSSTVSLFVSEVTTVPPSVSITSPAQATTFADDFVVTVSASSPLGLARIYVQATGATDTLQEQLVPLDTTTGKPPLGPYTTTFTVPVPGGALGQTTLIAQAIDVYGNAMTSAAVTVILDPAASIIVGNGITVRTVSGGGMMRRPQGVAVDSTNNVYVTNADPNFPLVVKINPAGAPLSNQSAFVTAQAGRSGQDIVFASTPNAFFISTAGINSIARVDAAGTNLMLGWTANIGRVPFGLAMETPTSIAALYSDRFVRRYNASSTGPATPSTSSMDASANLAGAWGLEVLNFGCKANQFRCGSGECIANTSVCNLNVTCVDGSDEGATTCASPGNFKCTAGSVASTSVANICSGRSECADNSDEAGCSRYVATDAGANDEAWSFYDDDNTPQTAFDLRLDNGLAEPRGVARSPSGAYVYIASRGGNAIYQVNSNAILSRNPCPGGCPTVASGFDEAFGLVFDGNGNLLVTDRNENVVYSLTGLP